MDAEQVFFRLLVSIIIGGMIGAEREFRSKSAGLRTLMLICVGSAIFTMLSIEIGERTSPDRIASNIVTGIGFVGAGVIFKNENRMNGITTASAIWMTAALGMAIGAGHLMAGFVGCVITLLVLLFFQYLEGFIGKAVQTRNYTISCQSEISNIENIEKVCLQLKLKITDKKLSKDADTIKGYWTIRGSAKNQDRFVNQLLADKAIRFFGFDEYR